MVKLNENQELLKIINDCISYLTLESEKNLPLLNDKTIIDTLDYIITECYSQYQAANLPDNKHSRGYNLYILTDNIKANIWNYIIIK